MTNNTVETQVDLIADGDPVLKALDAIKTKITTIQTAIGKTMETANKGAKDFDHNLAGQVKSLQSALGQMNALAKFAESGGLGKGPITAINQEKALAKATIAASQFAKTIKNAETASEALLARLNAVEKKAASIGAVGGLESRKQETTRKNLEQQIALLKRLDAEQAKLDARANRTRNSDFSGDRARVNATRSALEAKLLNPRASNFSAEFNELAAAQQAYGRALDGVRTKRSDMLRMAREEENAAKAKARIEAEADKAYALQHKSRAAQEAEAYRQHEAHLKAEAQLEKEGAEEVAAANRRRMAQDKKRNDEAKALLNDIAAAEAKVRSTDTKFNRGLIPGQVAGAIAGGAGDTIRLETEARLVAARERYLLVGAKDKQQALAIVELEQLRLREINKQLAAKEREAAGGQGGNILPAGGMRSVLARTAAYGAAGTGIFAVVGAMQQGATAAIELEDGLGKLQAIAGATDGQMVTLTESILAVGETSRFSLAELTDAATTLAQAGFSTADIEKSLGSVSTLAAAAGTSTAQAVDVLTSAVSAFGLSTNGAGALADSLTSALNRSKLTISDVASAIQTAGATAASSNMTFQELTATIGAMGQAGVKGQMASTGLRQFLTDLTGPTQKLSDKFHELGISFADVDVSTRGLPAVLETLTAKGFGSAEAFGSLEHRSAAAFLVMRRQVPLMRELTLAQNDSGVATEAAAKATNTLAAQWQIFKNNLLSTAATNPVTSFLGGLPKEILTTLNNVREYNKLMRDGLAIRRESFTTPGGFDEAMKHAQSHASAILSMASAQESYNAKMDAAKTASKTAQDAFDAQKSVIESLDGAINRLVARQGDLKDNSVALKIETSNMSKGFEGLALHLDTTTSSFGNLLAAAQQYRLEQVGVMKDLATLNAQKTADQREVARRGAEVQYQSVISKYGKYLTPKMVSELDDVRSSHSSGTLIDKTRADFRSRLTDSPMLKQIEEYLNRLQAFQAYSNIARADTSQVGVLSVRQSLDARFREADKLTNSQADRAKVNSSIAKIDKEITGSKDSTLISVLSDLRTVLQGKLGSPGSLLDPRPTHDRGPPVTRSDVIAGVLDVIPGAKPGSGYRTMAQQDKLHVEGNTPATGLTSTHSNGGIGQDFPMSLPKEDGIRLAQQIKAHLKNIGIDAQVQWETGRGRNQGTGGHIHVGVRKGTVKGTGSGDASGDVSIDQVELNTAAKVLEEDIKDLKKNTGFAVYDAGVVTATKSFDAWSKRLTDLTNSQIAKGGFTDAQTKERLAALDDQIKQKKGELDQGILDGLTKTLDAAFAAAELAFQKAIQPAEAYQAKMEAQLSGLDFASNQGRVPDYVRTLAQQRVDKAKEDTARSHLEGFNQKIASQQSDLNSAKARRDDPSTSEANAQKAQEQIDLLTTSLEKLRAERDALDVSLNTGGLIPTTFSEGLNQAIAALKGAGDYGLSFKQMLIGDIGGALDQVKLGFQDFFTTISTGSGSILGAFGNMAKGIMRYMEQMAAKALATQIFNLILGAIGSVGGASVSASGGSAVSAGGSNAGASLGASIKPVYTGGPIGYSGGGEVMNGSSARDSVHAKLARGEFVMQKTAVDSVGRNFMARLNSRGAQALSDLKQAPSLVMGGPKQEMKVFVVAPEQKPSLGPNDVLMVITDDLLKGGTTRQLVKHISQGG